MFGDPIPDDLFSFLPEIKEQLESTRSVIDDDYPHVSTVIRNLWGSEECMEYMEDLINYAHTSERPTRQGFSFEAVKELNLIIQCHHKQFPNLNTKYKVRSEDLWNIK